MKGRVYVKNLEFNNIEENKFVMGYIHYKNIKNKIVYKKAIGYIVPEEDLIFCISSHEYGKHEFEELMYEKSDGNDMLYCSITSNEVFELKKYIYPDSDKKISAKALMELIPLLEKYVLDEDFEPSQRLKKDYNNDMGKKLKSEIKQLMLINTVR